MRVRGRAWSLGALRQPARLQLQPHYDPEAFGRFSEAIARVEAEREAGLASSGDRH